MYFAIFNGFYRASSRRNGFLLGLNYIRVNSPFLAKEGKSLKGVQNFAKFSTATRLGKIHRDSFLEEPRDVADGEESPGRIALKTYFENRRIKNKRKEDYYETEIEDPEDEMLSKVYACRYYDEVFFGISGSKETALRFKSEVLKYLRGSLRLNVEGRLKLIPCGRKKSAIRAMGTTVRQAGGDSPSMRAYHRLKEKAEYFAQERRVEEFLYKDMASTSALMKIPESETQPMVFTQVLAPVEDIQMRLLHHRVGTSEGSPRDCSTITTIDDETIIDWFATIARQWIRWYSKCDNFYDIKCFICNHLRMSCIHTLSTKHRLSVPRIRAKFGNKLNSRIRE